MIDFARPGVSGTILSELAQHGRREAVEAKRNALPGGTRGNGHFGESHTDGAGRRWLRNAEACHAWASALQAKRSLQSPPVGIATNNNGLLTDPQRTRLW